MKRPIYQNAEAEKGVLSILLNDARSLDKIFLELEADDFFVEANRTVFLLGQTLWRSKEPIDLVTLSELAEKTERMRPAGGMSYLSELYKDYYSSVPLPHYIEILKEQSCSRRCVSIAKELCEQAGRPQEAVAQAMEALGAVGSVGGGNLLADMDEAFEEVEKYLRQVQEKGEVVDGIRTPFRRMNYFLGNFQNGEVIVFAARPGVGKSALINQILIHTALYENKKVALFSLEMSSLQILLRMYANLSDRSLYDLRKGNFAMDEMEVLSKRLKETGLVVEEKRFELEEICRECRILKKKSGLDMICIDYLQLVCTENGGRERRVEVDTISRKLKLLAKELQVPVIALSQMNRSIELTDREPTLSDLRESGAIEQDASQVIFLHRNKAAETRLKYQSERERYLEIIVAKNRQGAVGKMYMRFEADKMRFGEIESDGSELKAPPARQARVEDLEPYYGDLPFDLKEKTNNG